MNLDDADPPDYPNFNRDRERLKQAVDEPYILWETAYRKMASAVELENASEAEIVAATMRAIIKLLPS